MADQRQETGRIVVGVDGSEASRQALAWAVRYAGLTGGAVTAVAAWDFPAMHGARWLPPSSSDAAALEDRARRHLADAVAKAVEAQSPVEVTTEVR